MKIDAFSDDNFFDVNSLIKSQDNLDEFLKDMTKTQISKYKTSSNDLKIQHKSDRFFVLKNGDEIYEQKIDFDDIFNKIFTNG